MVGFEPKHIHTAKGRVYLKDGKVVVENDESEFRGVEVAFVLVYGGIVGRIDIGSHAFREFEKGFDRVANGVNRHDYDKGTIARAELEKKAGRSVEFLVYE